MTKWYKTGGYKSPIEEVSVLRETTHQLIIVDNIGRESRSAK